MRSLLLLPLLLLTPGRAWAGSDAVQVSVDAVGEVLVLRGAFEVPASPAVAWQVLTDYGQLPQFVPGLQGSRVLHRDGAAVDVAQEGVAELPIGHLTLHLELAIHEQAPREIDFHDVGGQDFALYAGSWALQAGPAGSLRVVYLLRAKPRSGAPAFIAAHLLESSARSLLESVRAEIQRQSLRRSTP